MPGRSGIDLLRELSATHAAVPVVLLTARIEHEQVLEALKLGVAGIVLKESAPLQILDCIRRVAAGGQWIDQTIGSRTLDSLLRGQSGVMKVAAILTGQAEQGTPPGPGGVRATQEELSIARTTTASAGSGLDEIGCLADVKGESDDPVIPLEAHCGRVSRCVCLLLLPPRPGVSDVG